MSHSERLVVRRRRSPRYRTLLGAVAATTTVVTLAGCGSAATPSSSGGAATSNAPATVLPATAPATTAASPQCPSGATAGAALGLTLPNPVSVSGGTQQIPAGASGISCEYHAASYNVIIEVITNVDPSTIATFSARFPVPYQSVSGVGDQARSFVQSLGGGRDNKGLVATKGKTLVALTATATPASLAQIEALVGQLL